MDSVSLRLFETSGPPVAVEVPRRQLDAKSHEFERLDARVEGKGDGRVLLQDSGG
jgi:hypothetical protein